VLTDPKEGESIIVSFWERKPRRLRSSIPWPRDEDERKPGAKPRE
jgi:hypothetical protein